MKRLLDRDFRRAFAEEAIDVGVPIQIREMRRARGWSQRRLGEEAGMAQEQVSLAEKLSYGRFTVATLKRLAAAFDCALIVRFAPYSELIAWKDRIDAADVTPPSFEADTCVAATTAEIAATDNVIDLHAFLRGTDKRRSPRSAYGQRATPYAIRGGLTTSSELSAE